MPEDLPERDDLVSRLAASETANTIALAILFRRDPEALDILDAYADMANHPTAPSPDQRAIRRLATILRRHVGTFDDIERIPRSPE